MYNELKQLANKFADYGCKLYIVGGHLREVAIKRNNLSHLTVWEPTDGDVDLAIDGGRAIEALTNLGAKPVFTSNFPVYLLNGYEIAVCRGERSTGAGRNEVEFFPSSIEDDLRRRDLTVNAMAWDITSERLIDPYNGMADCKAKTLRAVALEIFQESIERPLRLAAFVARLGWGVESATKRVCLEMAKNRHLLPREQVWRQCLLKVAKKGHFFSQFFAFLVETGWVDVLPDLNYVQLAHGLSNFINHRTKDNAVEMFFYVLCRASNLPPNEVAKKVGWVAGNYGETRKIVAMTERLRAIDATDMPVKFIAAALHPYAISASHNYWLMMGQDYVVEDAIHDCVYDGRELPLISGDDLNIPPSRQMGAVLAAVYNAQLNGIIRTKEDAREFANSLL